MTRYVAFTAAVLLTAACGTSGATPPAEVRVKLIPPTSIERSPEETFAELAQRAATTTTSPAVRRVAVRRSSRRVGVVGASPSAAGRAAPLDCIARYESGGRYDAISSAGHRGRYQFAAGTWRGAVTRAGYPEWANRSANEAPPHVQDAAAAQLYAERGLQPWPTPSRRCA